MNGQKLSSIFRKTPCTYSLLFAVLSFSTITLAQNANVIVNNSTVKIVSNGSPYIVLNNANYVNNASSTHFTGASSTVKVVGGSATLATISSNGAYETVFNNLWMERPNGLSLLSPATATGTLRMIQGNISTTAANLLTVGASTTIPGSVNWTDGTVVGPLKRFYATTANAAQAAGIFPIGNSTYNRYAQINYTSNMGTGGYIIAEYKNGVCPIGSNGLPAIINGQLITNFEEQGYWDIRPTGGNLNATNYDLLLRGNHLTPIGNMSDFRIIKSVGHTAWNDNVPGDGNHVAATGSITDFIIGATAMNSFSWFDIGYSNDPTPLPVKLTRLTASCGTGKVVIKWSTASEQNSDYFILEKSRDLETWHFLTNVDAAGNSNFTKDYQSVDENPWGGIAYYRLVQVDYDGTKTTYGPVSVVCDNSKNDMIVFPNPSQGHFTVEISSSEAIANAQLTLIDMAGKIVMNQNLSITQGNNQILFNDADLQAGTYIVKLYGGKDHFQPVKLVINN